MPVPRALLCPAEELFQTIAENECIADLTSSHDELEKLMLVNGTEPRCGVINHYGWYEDAGYKDMKTLAGRMNTFLKSKQVACHHF